MLQRSAIIIGLAGHSRLLNGCTMRPNLGGPGATEILQIRPPQTAEWRPRTCVLGAAVYLVV